MTIKDKDGFAHEMEVVAHRCIALCGYLNLDNAHVRRGAYKVDEYGKPTCEICLKLLAVKK